MQQSNFIFGMLLIAFIVFITVRGELSTYLSLLRGGGTSPSTSTGGTASGTGTGLPSLPSLPSISGVGNTSNANVATGLGNASFDSDTPYTSGSGDMLADMGY